MAKLLSRRVVRVRGTASMYTVTVLLYMFCWRKVIKEVRWPRWVWAGECFFWYRPTRVVPDTRPLNGCCCCCCILLVFKFSNSWNLLFRSSQIIIICISASMMTVNMFVVVVCGIIIIIANGSMRFKERSSDNVLSLIILLSESWENCPTKNAYRIWKLLGFMVQ